MKEHRLRYHIPPGAPPTREYFIGDEPDLRACIGFTPRFYRDRLGIDFSERWHSDPVHRYDTLVKMKEYLHESFPMIPDFIPQYDGDSVERSCATISGVHGIMLLSSLYGLDVEYREDNWPDAKGGMHIPKENLIDLETFDLMTIPIIQQLFEQMDVLEEKYGIVTGYLNQQGVLNVAMKVRGNEIFMDFYEDPEFARAFFNHIAGTIRDLAKIVQKRQRASGFEVDFLTVGNCVINLISPGMYEEFLLPHDSMLSKEFDRFGVHTCNWDATRYLEPLRKIENVGYIDMGGKSDLQRAKELFPEARRNVLYHAVDFETKPIDEVRRDLERFKREYSPCDIGMSNIESTTPNSRVIEVYKLVNQVLEESVSGS